MKKIINKITALPGSILKFFRTVGTELKKTEFPTRPRSFRLAGVVLMGMVVISLTLFGIDALFIFIRTYLTQLNQ